MLFEFLKLWVPYKILWNNDLSERRDLSTVSLLDSEVYLQKHHELLERLNIKPDTYEFGSCVLVSVGEYKCNSIVLIVQVIIIMFQKN
jgi:dynein heavy chain, axonemal